MVEQSKANLCGAIVSESGGVGGLSFLGTFIRNRQHGAPKKWFVECTSNSLRNMFPIS